MVRAFLAVAIFGGLVLGGAATAAADPYYKNCAAARQAGAAPIHQGEPGYASHLDRDGDGIACE
ncbi:MULTISPECIES: excalibur calcium-binding domain-containing protein [unclassified Mycolicibacterium]|uniref:excalibur calcium-binding domain-containing protein n=1 Tax=unclassified Mycolicibacterium TaxID=2636767 RepID=UPI0012DDAA89|nr:MULTISPECIES: excalibur calcium-binding domain-containing protein [unclassified Mycolicibacterium]MUL83497.1 excalibur calcium-binding domain-containing protein [Mycolicibacterium sp. CBMA 329]MUL90488.1 excalibur calcium-binding domain-containing protein [Mycolicibacterium sp. CBMA 331]MUM00460.1 excalibur calcium-binding domain-containing protein [Mycolicibacterium sp. CBMA 334]MUM28754.1 excalibur calcium-binding domain-containing protein [Mycolicibacterium sp. CBMA 295]MUM41432.1 excali